MSRSLRAPIRVLIADGDPLVCRALVRLLQDATEVEVVGTATDGETVLERTAQLGPAVAVLDAHTARLDGLAVTRSLRRQQPALHIVVLSVYATAHDAALAAGACRFLLKDCSRDALVAAIRLVTQGHCQPHGDHPAADAAPSQPRSSPVPLLPRPERLIP